MSETDTSAIARAVERARQEGVRAERERHRRVYAVVVAAMRVIAEDVRHLGKRVPSPDDQAAAERIASSVDGAIESMTDMKPRAA